MLVVAAQRHTQIANRLLQQGHRLGIYGGPALIDLSTQDVQLPAKLLGLQREQNLAVIGLPAYERINQREQCQRTNPERIDEIDQPIGKTPAQERRPMADKALGFGAAGQTKVDKTGKLPRAIQHSKKSGSCRGLWDCWDWPL